MEDNFMEEKLTFGKFILKKRKEKNMTQKELAEKLYVTESAVSKWERGISYPDISLVTAICEALGVSEHELITASEDLHQKEIERQASKYQKFIKRYLMTFYLIYGVTLLICFICNLAIYHTLSWFFIVLTSVMTAFSLTTLPVLLKKDRGIWTLFAFFVSLSILMLVCCIYTGGNWFTAAFASLLFSFATIFLPFVLRGIHLPKWLSSNKTLLCFIVDTVLLFALEAAVCARTGYLDRYFTLVCPVTLYTALYPWLLMTAIRYIKVNGLFRTAVCFIITAAFVLTCNGVLDILITHKPFTLPAHDFGVWSSEMLFNGNILWSIALACAGMAVLFAAGGIVLIVKRQKMR